MSYKDTLKLCERLTMKEAEEFYNTGKTILVLFEVDGMKDITETRYKRDNPQSFKQYIEDLEYFLADRILGYFIKRP